MYLKNKHKKMYLFLQNRKYRLYSLELPFHLSYRSICIVSSANIRNIILWYDFLSFRLLICLIYNIKNKRKLINPTNEFPLFLIHCLPLDRQPSKPSPEQDGRLRVRHYNNVQNQCVSHQQYYLSNGYSYSVCILDQDIIPPLRHPQNT